MAGDRRRPLGQLGEELAARHLERRGLRILERNFRTRWGEIDLVAADDGALVFCEVKTRRAGGGHPFESLRPLKRRQVRAIARAWLAGGRRPLRRELRFDAIGVVVDARGRLVALDHLEGAF